MHRCSGKEVTQTNWSFVQILTSVEPAISMAGGPSSNVQCENSIMKSRQFSILPIALGLIAALPSASTCFAQSSALYHMEAYTIPRNSELGSLVLSGTGNLGDVDGDGLSDLLITANDSGQTKAHILSGIDGSLIQSYNTDGIASTVGDITGDGIQDFVAGRNVLSGADGTQLFQFLDFQTTASSGVVFSYGGFGWNGGGNSAAAGDIDGDGIGDIMRRGRVAFSDPFFGDITTGAAVVFSGADGSELRHATNFPFYAMSPDANSYTAAVSLGDLNGDGVPDFAAGDRLPDQEDRDGYVDVYSGSGGVLYTLEIGGFEFDGDFFGRTITRLSDVDGDGVNDIAVGSLPSIFSEGMGQVHVFSGSTGQEIDRLLDQDFLDSIDNSAGFPVRFGEDVANAGDVNGDGIDDIIVGMTPWDTLGGEQEALAIIFSGDGFSEIARFSGGVADFGEFGVEVGAAGDINGDGYDDFIVGSGNGGINDEGYLRVFVSAVPEPSSAAVMVVFAFGVFLKRRRNVDSLQGFRREGASPR